MADKNTKAGDPKNSSTTNTGTNQGGGGSDDGDDDEGGDGDNWKPSKGAIASMVNAAVSSHLTRFSKNFNKEVQESFGSMLKPIQEKLESTVAAKPEGGNGGSNNKEELSPAIRELISKQEGRIRELEDKNREESTLRENERKARMRDEERTLLADALRKQGIDETRLKPAIALIYTEEQRVGRDEDGRVIMKVQKAGFVDSVELDKGIQDWLKTEEGKMFLPPRGASGGGTIPASGRNATKSKDGKMTPTEARLSLAAAMGVLPRSE